MKAKKSFGQHFLRNAGVMKKIVQAAEITPGDVVLEVGPGHGVLTQALVEAGAKVIAVEADRDLIPELEEKFGSSVQVIFSDILKFRISDLFGSSDFGFPKYKLVANLPYNIASAVLEKFLSADHPPSMLVVMVQKEVADRMQAKPGEMSVLSVACQLYTTMKRVVNVPPGSFSPPPKVDSAVVCLRPRHSVAGQDNEQVIALAKIGFRSRRKLLKSNLLATGAPKERIAEAFQKAGVDELARPQELSVDAWSNLWYNLRDL